MTRTSWAAGLGVVLLIVVLVAGIFVSSTFGRGYGWGMMGPGMMGPGMMGGYGYSIFGMLIPVLFLILIVAGVFWLAQALARSTSNPPTGGSSTDSPLDILRRRYAQGEINREQFDQMKRDLGAG